MITTKFVGRLGNLVFEIFNIYKYARDNQINFNDIIFNKNYIGSGCNPNFYKKISSFFRVENYIEFNREFFENIYDRFIDETEYIRLVTKIPQIQYKDVISKNIIYDNVFFVNVPPSARIETHEDLLLFKQLFYNPKLIQTNKTIYNNIDKYIALHIRRTDYAEYKNGKYLLSKDQIINIINNYLNRGETKFIIFSDDIDWCRNNILNTNNIDIIFHQPNIKSYNDMILMSLCKEIFANNGHSSFSKCAKILHQIHIDAGNH